MNESCLNCGSRLSGPYCAQCGQRDIVPADRGLMHLLGDAFTELTSLESRTWRSVACLLARPGELSSAYLAGARQRYLKPISLFLLVNLVYFFAPPINDFNLPLRYQANQYWGAAIVQLAEHKAARYEAKGRVDPVRDVLNGQVVPGYAALAQDYAVRSADVSKLLMVIHVPFLAFGLMLAFGFRRWWYAEHFVVALHLFAWVLAATMLLSVLGQALHVLGVTELRAIMNSIVFAVLALCWTLALRRVYSLRWPRAFATFTILLLSLFLGHFVYRFVQGVLVLSLL